MYMVNDENIVVRASSPLRGVPHWQREALYHAWYYLYLLMPNHKNFF